MKVKTKKSLSQKTLGGFAWLASGSAIEGVLQLVVTAILARVLSPSDFGLVAMAIVVVRFAEMIYEMGISPAIVQSKDLDDGHINSAFTFSVGLGFVLVGIFWFANPILASFFDMPELTEVLNLLVWLFPLRTFSQISYSLLQRDLQFKKMAGLDAISYLIGYGVVGIPLAFLGYGVWSLVWATLSQAFIYCLLIFWAKPMKFRLEIKGEKLKELLGFGAGFTLGQLFNFFARKGDYLIVGKVLGASSLGIYSRAYSIMNFPNNIAGTVMGKVLFPSFAKISDSKERMKSALEKSYSILFLLMIPASVSFIFITRELVLILLGEKWLPVEAPLQILLSATVLRIGYKIGGSFTKGNNLVYKGAFFQAIYCIAVIVGSYLGTKWGETGVAIGVTIALILHFLLMTNLAVQNSNMSWAKLIMLSSNGIALTLIISPICYFTTYYLRIINFPPFLILMIILSIMVLIIIFLAYINSSSILGKHGVWLVTQVKNFLKENIASLNLKKHEINTR